MWWRHLNRFFACPICCQPLTDHWPLCRYCLAAIARFAPASNRLSSPLWRRALKYQPLTAIYSSCAFSPLIRQLLHLYKYRRQRHWAPLLARLLWHQVRPLCPAATDQPPWLVAVPLHPRRLRQRGFNQSLLLARLLSHYSGYPLAPADWLQRCRQTPPQAGLDGRQRRQNLRQAFVCQPQWQQRAVILVDDVLTTGTTASTIARLLLKHQAASVQLWTLAAVVPSAQGSIDTSMA